MHELWSSASYEPHLLSLPFAFAPAAMLIVIAYTIVMRGAPALRGWLLAHCLSLLPYAVVMTLSPSITSQPAALALFRFAAAFIPMAAACGTGFQLALLRRHNQQRWLVWFLFANAAIWVIAGSSSGIAVRDVRRLAGFWYPDAGPYAWLALLHTVALSLPGFYSLGMAAWRSKPSDERRQLRAALLANLVTYSGLVDVGLAYGIGVFPIGWLLSGVGSLLVQRAITVEDLLRVRAVDTAAPRLVLHFAGALLLSWVALSMLPAATWWGVVATLALCCTGVRVTVSLVGLVHRGGRRGDGPLDRLLGQLVGRATALTDDPAIAQLAIDVIELALGVRPEILLAATEDWGWTTQTGVRLADEHAPDPFLASWLAEQRAAIFAGDPELDVPEDLAPLLDKLFEVHRARTLVAVRSHDELLGLIVIRADIRRLRGRSLHFLERAAERLAESLIHARMTRHAAARAELAREVELAATVQAELLPNPGLHVFDRVSVIGSWQPATRCAGDFWGVHQLDNGRVLISIGDVTGHGVASAMVTAAAIAACDVTVRRQNVELGTLMMALDSAVRRVGGGELAMTCFAAILDPAAGELSFVSCGHTAPYLLRIGAAAGSELELHALVARGNLLGTGVPVAPRVQKKPLQAGDVVVWYTDGVIEAEDPGGRAFGDRRLQQLLKKLDRQRFTPGAVHDVVQASVAAFRAGKPLADDETIVVAQVKP